MSKITIIEGNSNDKDQVRNFMVKGERGDDGVSPTFETSKTGNVATITITDVEGTHSVQLVDGVDLTGGVPTNGVIAFDGTTIPNGYEEVSGGFVTSDITGSLSNLTTTSKTNLVSAINEVNGKTEDIYSTTETATNKKWGNKTIYRMVLNPSMPSTNGGELISFEGLNADNIFIDESHSFFTFSNGYQIPLNYYSGTNDWTRCYLNSTGAYLNFGSSVSSNVSSITVTIEYTKS